MVGIALRWRWVALVGIVLVTTCGIRTTHVAGTGSSELVDDVFAAGTVASVGTVVSVGAAVGSSVVGST